MLTNATIGHYRLICGKSKAVKIIVTKWVGCKFRILVTNVLYNPLQLVMVSHLACSDVIF